MVFQSRTMWLRACLLGMITTAAALNPVLAEVAAQSSSDSVASTPAVAAPTIVTIPSQSIAEPAQNPTGEQTASVEAAAAKDTSHSSEPTIDALNHASTSLVEARTDDQSTRPSVPSVETTDRSPESIAVEAPEPSSSDVTAAASPISDILILAPVPEGLIPEKSTSVTVQLPAEMAVEVRVNGQLLDAADVGQLQLLPATQQVKQTWYNVPLRSGTNTISVYKPGDLTPLTTATFYSGSKPKTQAEGTPSPAGEVSPSQAVRIVNPSPDALIDQPATSVTVQSPIGEALELRVNGRLIDSAQIGRTETNIEAQLMRQTWYGVTLSAGNNDIAVHRQGEVEPVTVTTVQLRGKPDKLRLRTLESRIPADGRSTATVQGQLLDRNNNRSNWNAVVTLDTTEGEFVGVDHNPDAPGFQVKAINGQFTATLQSGLQAGLVRVRATSNELEGFHQFEFATPLRSEGLLTGVIDFRLGRRGTNFFDSYRDFLPKDGDHPFEVDLEAKAFGITSVGEWLITGALNTERPLNADCNGEVSLFRAVGDCDDSSYTVYGDDSTTEVVTPSTDNLYLRLERTSPITGAGIDYFLWGDYRTEEFNQPSQLFTATGRDLHGFKANYNFGNLQVTGIYGNNVDGFQRDTIAPDGTSGFYFLSRRLLVPGSEEIYLELEELNRPGTVIERHRLRRGPDYEIDYDRGSILFREPVLRTDIAENGQILVRRIVSTYQFEEDGGDTDVFGGRLQYNFSRELNRSSWLGTTYFLENRGDQEFQLYGADAQISFGKDGQLIAEYAHSDNDLEFGDKVSGDAYRLNLSGTLFGKVNGNAYFRTTDAGFSNNATTSFVPGQTRYGAQLDAQVTQSTSLRVSYDHEDNFGVAPDLLNDFEELISPGLVPIPGQLTDNSLTTIRAGVGQKIGRLDLGVDWVYRDRKDSITNRNLSSHQLSTSLHLPVTNDLSLHAYNDLNLSSESDPLYPNRITVGADWQIHPGITIGLNNTYFDGGQFDNELLTSLGIRGEHTFSTDTTLRGELAVIGDYGVGGRFGIDQGVRLAPGLNMDFSYENVFSRAFTTAAGPQFSQPFAVGSGASALSLTNGHSFSAGISYTDNPDLQLGARIEHRTSSARGSNTVITANALGKINRDLTALFRFQQASAANQRLSDLGVSRDIKLGLAYRNPTDDTFNGLLRYEYRQNPSTIPDSILLGRGTGSEEHLLSVEGIYVPKWNWEFYGKLGLRHSRTNLAQDLVGTSTVSLAQLRATHRFDYRWDVAAEGRWIGQPSVGFNEVGLNLEVGYYLNPNIRFSVGYAFGAVDDRDLGNSRNADGLYLGVTLKLDNNLLKDFGFQKPSVPQQQESVISQPAGDAVNAIAPADSGVSGGETTPTSEQAKPAVETVEAATEAETGTLKETAAPVIPQAVDLPRSSELPTHPDPTAVETVPSAVVLPKPKNRVPIKPTVKVNSTPEAHPDVPLHQY